MSSCESSEDEQEDDAEAEGGGGSGSDNVPGGDEDGRVQRRLHLFRCASIQHSLRRLWDILPKDENGELTMDGYVEFNLRLQKCLTPEFAIERAVDSAIGDWCEDVHEGQEAMTEQDFAMFLFELSSLWCGPAVSLRVYLLFLCSTFIAISEARGSHTVGLRPLDSVERLPKSFFDMLSLQGWARLPEDEAGMTEAQALAVWHQRNLAPESEQAALLQVQRQIFHVTHDVRSVLLFRQLDGRQQDEPTVLELVKQATQHLDKVTKAPVPGLPALKSDGHAGRASPRTEIVPLPWCPPTHTRAPGGPTIAASAALAARTAAGAEATAANALALAHPPSGGALRRGQSAPGAPRRPSLAAAAAAQQRAVPLGRAFDTRRTAGTRGRGLALAGRAALGSNSGELALRPEEGVRAPSSAPAKGSQANVTVGFTAESWAIAPSSSCATGPSVMSAPKGDPWQGLESPSYAGLGAGDYVDDEEPAGPSLELTAFVEAASFLPAYKLPKKPEGLYQNQVEPIVKNTPSSILFEAKRWQMHNKLVPEPFERVQRKLPEGVDPGPKGPGVGPMGNPNEPVWFEMNHRLQAILKRQGRRAERRRKRKLRSKLLTGRTKGLGKKSDGRNLREYLDKAALERAENQGDIPAKAPGEFLAKVQKEHLRRREAFLQRHFQEPPAPLPVARPVYCPPPGARMEQVR